MPWYRRGGSSVRAPNVALNGSLGHQLMGAVPYRGRSSDASTKESHVGTGSCRGMIGAAEEWNCFRAHIRLREPGKSVDKAEMCLTLQPMKPRRTKWCKPQNMNGSGHTWAL
ncbi:unnamed protein product [Musa textilis]